MPKIYDNQEHHLVTGLNETIELSTRTDFCIGYFNLRGWREVANKIDCLAGAEVIEGNGNIHRCCRILIGMQKMPVEIIKDYFVPDDEKTIDQQTALKLKKMLAREFREQLTIGTPSNADEWGLRKLSQQMKDGKVVVKLFLRYPMHAKLYLTFSNDKRVPVVGFLGSSNLTLAGLVRQGELNIDVLEQDAANKLSAWFEDKWNDRWCLDITKELIEIIDESWATETLRLPYHIYLKIAYHLSREARAGLNEFKLPSVFRKELLEFQQKAVLVAAHHLHKRGGVVIGDVVGLGKTITASAIAKIFEDDFFLETLIISPKNLVEMWDEYVHKYQLRAKIISLSMVQKELPDLRRYRLIIIDESHNLRNDQGSRYRAIKSYIEENESKIILLSATPYNKSFVDLSNQLRLFISDDKDLGISPEKYIESIGGQIQFMARHSETFIRSIKAFERSDYTDDWRELMRLYLVRRTRSFIKENYAESDSEKGRKYLTFSDGTRSYFPDRIPKKVEYRFDPNDRKDQYAKLYSQQVIDSINGLELPRYGLGNYLEEQPAISPTRDEQVIMENLSRAGKRLMGFCRTNLFKRLESSGHSFLLSLSRHIMRNYLFIYALEHRKPLPIGQYISQNLDYFLDDSDIDNQEENSGKRRMLLDEDEYLQKAEELYRVCDNPGYRSRFDWIRSEFFRSDLLEHLIHDCREIIKILKTGKDWNPNDDRKLNALHKLLTESYPKEKVIAFTQYADTALYLEEHLKRRGIKKLESVTGDDENPTGLAHRFSPVSNNKINIVNTEQELRVLISTDVLSEGQNLQDAHIILNYDLPWAIIRLIQRSGRVDRIGQMSDKILCYSFLPEDGIENIIKLRGRLRTRISENAEVVGSDETFFEGDPINIEDLYNERAGILDDEQEDNEVDLASYAYQIWKNATDKDPKLKKQIPDLPNVVYATKQNTIDAKKEGVIVYTRTVDDNDVLSWMDTRGNVLTQSQLTILKVSQCEPDTKPLNRMQKHHQLVEKSIAYIRDDERNTGGTLGKKTGVKYRVYMRLDRYIRENEGTIFITEELKKAVDDIYKYPIREFARDSIGRHLKAGISDEDLANLVVSLREEDKLCIIDEEEPEYREPQIICSLGLKNE